MKVQQFQYAKMLVDDKETVETLFNVTDGAQNQAAGSWEQKAVHFGRQEFGETMLGGL